MSLDTIEQNLQALIRVQDADRKLDDLAKARKIASEQIELNEAKMKAFAAQADVEKKLLLDIQKNQKMMEIEVASLETKTTKYQNQLLEVKSNKDYDALKLEIDHSKNEKAKVEDKILTGLFNQDEQKKKIEVLNKQIAEDQKMLAVEKTALQAKATETEKVAVEKQKEREEQLALVDREWSEAYTQLRKSGKKVALAEVLDDHTCSGCRMSLPPQTMIEVRKMLQVQRCTCGRLLFSRE